MSSMSVMQSGPMPDTKATGERLTRSSRRHRTAHPFQPRGGQPLRTKRARSSASGDRRRARSFKLVVLLVAMIAATTFTVAGTSGTAEAGWCSDGYTKQAGRCYQCPAGTTLLPSGTCRANTPTKTCPNPYRSTGWSGSYACSWTLRWGNMQRTYFTSANYTYNYYAPQSVPEMNIFQATADAIVTGVTDTRTLDAFVEGSQDAWNNSAGIKCAVPVAMGGVTETTVVLWSACAGEWVVCHHSPWGFFQDYCEF